MLSWNSFTSCVWHSAHFPGINFSAVVSSCTLPWQLAQAATPRMACALVPYAFTSSAWHVAHCAFATLAGCGKSLMALWQSWQPRMACALTACFAGLMQISLPLSDFMPAVPWQARQASSCFGGCAFLAFAVARVG